MHVRNDKFKFKKKLSDLFNLKCSKENTSVIDEQLKHEYETFLSELESLSERKSCRLSFKNDKFNAGVSSKELTKLFNSHSSEVIERYIEEHHSNGNHKNLTRDELLAYLTEIIITPNQCDDEICIRKRSKFSVKANTSSRDCQTAKVVYKDKSTGVETNLNHKDVQFNGQGKYAPIGAKTNHAFVQTDASKEIDTNTSQKLLKQDVGTLTSLSHLKDVSTWPSPSGFKAASTSDNILIRSREKLLKPNSLDVSACTNRQDCECEAYDVKVALERGLVLPSSDVYIQQEWKQDRSSQYVKEDPDSSSDSCRYLNNEESKTRCFLRRKKAKRERQGNHWIQTVPIKRVSKNNQTNTPKKAHHTAQTSTDEDVSVKTYKQSGAICNKCGKEKRSCMGCRNTIIVPTRDSECLRFLIKMQAKDNDRRFNTIMNQLNHQANEIHRLNQMYYSMIEEHYATRQCGFDGVNKFDNYNSRVKRFEAKTSAAATNVCETCNINNGRSFMTSNYVGGDKQYKDILNQSKKSEDLVSGDKIILDQDDQAKDPQASFKDIQTENGKTEQVDTLDSSSKADVHLGTMCKLLRWLKTSWNRMTQKDEEYHKGCKCKDLLTSTK